VAGLENAPTASLGGAASPSQLAPDPEDPEGRGGAPSCPSADGSRRSVAPPPSAVRTARLRCRTGPTSAAVARQVVTNPGGEVTTIVRICHASATPSSSPAREAISQHYDDGVPQYRDQETTAELAAKEGGGGRSGAEELRRPPAVAAVVVVGFRWWGGGRWLHRRRRHACHAVLGPHGRRGMSEVAGGTGEQEEVGDGRADQTLFLQSRDGEDRSQFLECANRDLERLGRLA
jgi:hypothetical protein